MYQSPPQIDPRDLRPGRGWFVAAGVIALVFILIGAGGFAWGLVTAMGEVKMGQRFDAGETVTVRMLPDPKTAVFARAGASGLRPDAECTVTSAGGQTVPVTAPSGTFTSTINGVTWHEIYVVEVTDPGDYRVTCESTQTSGFATGKAPELGKFVGGIAGGIAALFVLSFVGMAIGAIIAIVTGVKRGNHRKRLLAERYGRPQQPGWPQQPG
jgi:hypothetical protein